MHLDQLREEIFFKTITKAPLAKDCSSAKTTHFKIFLPQK